MGEHLYTALILAGKRKGPADELAEAGGVSHKCFIDIAGKPMLNRVVEAVAQSGRVGRILLSIDTGSIEEARERLAPTGVLERIIFVPSGDSIAASVMEAVKAHPGNLPLVITTGDNALHTSEMVCYFCDSLDDLKSDVALGVTNAETLLARYPDGQRAFHRFRDGEFSSCNIYALMNDTAVNAARAFATGGQFGKRPWRVVRIFGISTFILYKLHLASLRTFINHVARALKVTGEPVMMPFAEGPVDVDRLSDWKKANAIIAAREQG